MYSRNETKLKLNNFHELPDFKNEMKELHKKANII